jgi:hypothetical protein
MRPLPLITGSLLTFLLQQALVDRTRAAQAEVEARAARGEEEEDVWNETDVGDQEGEDIESPLDDGEDGVEEEEQ